MIKNSRIFFVIAILAVVAVSTENFVYADIQDHDRDLPLYEIGVAAATFFMHDYPAARQGSLCALAVPYAYYRGKVLRADDEGGLRSRLVEKERMEFDFSASAGFPADSRDNQARQGMPDIDWIGEVGPRLRVHLFDQNDQRWNFNLPVRYVFSTNFKRFDDRGYLFQPEFEYRHENVFQENWNFTFLVSFIFASDQLMDYFYEVSDQYANPERPYFQAQGGYLGTTWTLGASRRLQSDFAVFCGVKMDDFRHSVNNESPLFKSPINWSFAFGFSYRLFTSSLRAGGEI